MPRMLASLNRRSFLLASSVGVTTIMRATGESVGVPDPAIREILTHRVDVEKGATGMAVGIVDHGRRRVITYGHLGDGDSRSVDGNTLFEIGSVTKVFTALLLAGMAHRHELDFNDPVDRYLPTGFRTPQRNGRSITLADLATHTAGLPSFPPVEGNVFDAIGRYSVDALRSWLAGFTLTRDPGAQWEYSNVGYTLLGLALANKAGVDFDILLRRRIIEPLELRSTVLDASGEIVRRLAVGHDRKLNPLPPFASGIFAPAGSLRSTITDVLSFVTAVMPNSRSQIAPAAQLLLSIRRSSTAVGGDQALGWEVVSGPSPFLSKDGVTPGQTASVVLDPMAQTGVVVLSNAFPMKLTAAPSGGVGAADLARHLLRPALPLG